MLSRCQRDIVLLYRSHTPQSSFTNPLFENPSHPPHEELSPPHTPNSSLKNPKIQRWQSGIDESGWVCLLFTLKSHCIKIPDDLFVWFGDNFITFFYNRRFFNSSYW